MKHVAESSICTFKYRYLSAAYDLYPLVTTLLVLLGNEIAFRIFN